MFINWKVRMNKAHALVIFLIVPKGGFKYKFTYKYLIYIKNFNVKYDKIVL
ncbi:hypothetical protein psyc5s11_07470 [Clostridium gelidum]|uniref:Uncharacterized protein n=1 Tax=Clostridium gelidum TaxID=704125 RepID=A0ABN6IR52_9CLOT|nr:hypothetical protein psyc5s11_07470 [Clostridium gelidum]